MWRILLLLIPLLIILVLGWGIQDVTVERFTITGLRAISTESFTLTAELVLENPSRIPVQVREVTYDVIVESTDEIISSGSADPFTLHPGLSETHLENEVFWRPTPALLGDLLLEDEVIIRVEGTARVGYPLLSVDIPFSAETDAKAYLREQATEAGRSILRDILG